MGTPDVPPSDVAAPLRRERAANQGAVTRSPAGRARLHAEGAQRWREITRRDSDSSAVFAVAASVTRAHAIRDIFVQIVGRIGNLLLGLIVVVATTRTLGVDGNGEWSTLLAISTITGYLVDPGLQTTALRMATASPDEQPGWLGALIALRVITGIVAAVACFAASAAVARSNAMLVAGALTAATALTSPVQALAVVFQLEVRNDRAIWFMTLNSASWAAVACVIAFVRGGIVPFAAGLLVTSTVAFLAQAAYVWRRTSIDWDGLRRHGRRLLSVGLVLGAGSALTIAYGKIDQVLVLHYGGTRGAGLYGAAYALLDRVQFLPVVVMTTLFPIVSAAWPANPQRAQRAIERGLAFMIIVSFSALAFIAGSAGPVLTLMFGHDFEPAANALRVLMASFIPGCVGYVVGCLALVVGRQRMLMLFALVGLLVNVAGNLILLPCYGYIAAAWMTLATEVAVICPAAYVSFKVLQISPARLRLPHVTVSALALGGAVWLTGHLGYGLAAQCVAGALVCPAGLLLTGAISATDRDDIVGWIRRRIA